MDDFHRASPDIYPLLKEYAKQMRDNPTDAEAFLWLNLRNKALGIGFKRQVVILDYIADFYAPEQQIIIEVDGGYHNLPEQILLDEARSERLESLGYNILRFTNEEVLNDIDTVLYKIRLYIYDVGPNEP